MEKIVRLGRTAEGSVVARISYEIKEGDGGRRCLSISGVIGPMQNGDAKGSCGQIVMEEWKFLNYAEGWDDEKVTKFRKIWNRWHLNDMMAGCEHQRDWPVEKSLQVQVYTQVGTRYEGLKACQRMGRTTIEEDAAIALSDKVWGRLTTGSDGSEAYPEGEIKRLIGENLLAPWKVEEEKAGWVYPYQHPEGLLCKPCPVCGYKYGSQWLYEEVPQDVIDWLFALPNADKKPAWV